MNDQERKGQYLQEPGEQQPQGAASDAATFRKKAEAIDLLDELLTATGALRSVKDLAQNLADQLRSNQIRQVLHALSVKAKEIQAYDEMPTKASVDGLSDLVAALYLLTAVRPETS